MVRSPFVDKDGLKKGAWSEEEDNKLKDYVHKYGHWNWKLLPKFAGLARCGKSCRLRWYNYLKPGMKHGNFNEHEHELIKKLHGELGNKWSAIAAKLPGRTDNEIKNYWHTQFGNKNRTTRHSSASKVKKIIKSPPDNYNSRFMIGNYDDQSQSDLTSARSGNTKMPNSDQVMYILESSNSISESTSLQTFDLESSSTVSLNEPNINLCGANYLQSPSSSSNNLISSFWFNESDAVNICYDSTVEISQDYQTFMPGFVNLEKESEDITTFLDSFNGVEDSFWSEPFVLDA